MNLTNCPACQKQISNSAETCPHCGHPIKKNKRATKLSCNNDCYYCCMFNSVPCYHIARFIQMSINF